MWLGATHLRGNKQNQVRSGEVLTCYTSRNVIFTQPWSNRYLEACQQYGKQPSPQQQQPPSSAKSSRRLTSPSRHGQGLPMSPPSFPFFSPSPVPNPTSKGRTITLKKILAGRQLNVAERLYLKDEIRRALEDSGYQRYIGTNEAARGF